jgi:hypothetical protein
MPAETPRVMLMLKRIRSLLSGLALALTGVGAVKRILALLCCFLLTSPSWAVNEKEIRALFWRNNAQNDAIYARYTMPASGTATSTLQAMSGANGYETTTLVNVVTTPIFSPGTISGAVCNTIGNADTGAVSITLYKGHTTTGASATTLTCNVNVATTSTTTYANGSSASVPVVQGDYVYWQATTTQSSWNTLNLNISWLFTPSNGQNGELFAGTTTGTSWTGGIATTYITGNGAYVSTSAESAASVILPTSGFITGFNVISYATMGGASEYTTIYICRNATATAGNCAANSTMSCQMQSVRYVATGTLSCTNPGTNTPIHFNAGDTLSIAVVGVGTSSVGTYGNFGIGWLPDNPGEYPEMGTVIANANTNVYFGIAGAWSLLPGTLTETAAIQSQQPLFKSGSKWSKLYFFQADANTSGQSRGLTLLAGSAANSSTTSATALTVSGTTKCGATTATGVAGGGNLSGVLCTNLGSSVTLLPGVSADFDRSMSTAVTPGNIKWSAVAVTQ